MSRFFSDKYKSLEPYTPGEQPKEMKYIKLNTNESPFPPSQKAQEYAMRETKKTQLYPDPECRELTQSIADFLGVGFDNVLVTNGSDEILNFAFMAYCDKETPCAFPDITYGFYSVFAQINNVSYTKIPLREDFTINWEDYKSLGKTIFIANPNAPTGLYLKKEEIEKIIVSNPDNIVVIDEAYVDFGGESCVPLIKKYDNLIVTQTFSKSRSMAGARLGFGVASEKIIQDLKKIKYSTNPYNINRMTMAMGGGTMADFEYTKKNCDKIVKNREYLSSKLKEMGFSLTDSKTNFVFAKHSVKSGEEIYNKLKEKGILVRHFSDEKISDYNRITIGSEEEVKILVKTLEEVL